MLTVICFSKNRPWQLKEYLRSATKYLKGQVEIRVLWTCDPPYLERYEKLQAMFPQVGFVCESRFEQNIQAEIASASEFVVFGVDDAFFYREFETTEAIGILRNVGDVFGYAVKMHPGLDYCQTFGTRQVVPPFVPIQNSLIWDRRLGTYDWNYPWDVIGTIYRKQDALALVNFAVEHHVRITTPNYFEGEIALLFAREHPFVGRFGRWMACPKHPVMSVITVNCVQQNSTPLYCSQFARAEDMNALFDQGRCLDEDHYRQHTFPSVHIGDLKLVT